MGNTEKSNSVGIILYTILIMALSGALFFFVGIDFGKTKAFNEKFKTVELIDAKIAQIIFLLESRGECSTHRGNKRNKGNKLRIR